jgi:hypothetical protein
MDKITRQYVRDLELGLSGRVALCLAMEARKPLIALTDDEPSTDAWRAAGR